MLAGENKILGEKPIPLPVCATQIPYALACAQAWTSGVKGLSSCV
jgi:hypothetical protein